MKIKTKKLNLEIYNYYLDKLNNQVIFYTKNGSEIILSLDYANNFISEFNTLFSEDQSVNLDMSEVLIENNDLISKVVELTDKIQEKDKIIKSLEFRIDHTINNLSTCLNYLKEKD